MRSIVKSSIRRQKRDQEESFIGGRGKLKTCYIRNRLFLCFRLGLKGNRLDI